jgi:hypothetical protein
MLNLAPLQEDGVAPWILKFATALRPQEFHGSPPQHLLLTVMLPPAAYFSEFPSSNVAILVTGMLIV